jgi:hypothetical protein
MSPSVTNTSADHQKKNKEYIYHQWCMTSIQEFTSSRNIRELNHSRQSAQKPKADYFLIFASCKNLNSNEGRDVLILERKIGFNF